VTKRATLDQLRSAQTKDVTVSIDGDEMVFTIAKIKVGQRRKVMQDCLDEDGLPDLERASCLAAQMCVTNPALSEADVDEIDVDVFLQLANEIAMHSGLKSLHQVATPDPKEGSDVVKSFPAEGSQPDRAVGVDAAAADEGAGLDA